MVYTTYDVLSLFAYVRVAFVPILKRGYGHVVS